MAFSEEAQVRCSPLRRAQTHASERKSVRSNRLRALRSSAVWIMVRHRQGHAATVATRRSLGIGNTATPTRAVAPVRAALLASHLSHVSNVGAALDVVATRAVVLAAVGLNLVAVESLLNFVPYPNNSPRCNLALQRRRLRCLLHR